MKIEYINTGVVFLWQKIQIDINQKRHESKSREITNIEKYFFLLIIFEMGRTRTKCMGRAGPSPARVNSGGVAGTKQEKKEGEKGWPAVATIIGWAVGGDM